MNKKEARGGAPRSPPGSTTGTGGPTRDRAPASMPRRQGSTRGLDASMPKLDASMLFEVEATICRIKDDASTRLDAPLLDGISKAVAGLIGGHASSQSHGDAAAYQAS